MEAFGMHILEILEIPKWGLALSRHKMKLKKKPGRNKPDCSCLSGPR